MPSKPTDIRIEDISFGYEDYNYRAPLKFGGVAITCATLVNVGLEDQTCPARTILPVFDAIRTPGVPKALLVYPELRHEPCADFNRHALHWLDTYL